MRTQTIEKTIYTIQDALNMEKQGDSGIIDSILEKQWDINVDSDWWDESSIESFKEIGLILGINTDKVYFSGFWSQGSGACFTGSYSYAKGWKKKLLSEFGGDWIQPIIAIGEQLQEIQRQHFYDLYATVEHNGHYYHEGCTCISVCENENPYRDIGESEEGIKEALRDFMRWMYSQLKTEYDYLTSRESILETLEINGYEFDSYGNIV